MKSKVKNPNGLVWLIVVLLVVLFLFNSSTQQDDVIVGAFENTFIQQDERALNRESKPVDPPVVTSRPSPVKNKGNIFLDPHYRTKEGLTLENHFKKYLGADYKDYFNIYNYPGPIRYRKVFHFFPLPGYKQVPIRTFTPLGELDKALEIAQKIKADYEKRLNQSQASPRPKPSRPEPPLPVGKKDPGIMYSDPTKPFEFPK